MQSLPILTIELILRPMKDQTPFRDLEGYVPVESAHARGPISVCNAKCQQSGALRSMEVVKQSKVSQETYEQIRHRWRQNQRHPTDGLLKQHRFEDLGDRLVRVLDLPAGPEIKSRLFQVPFELPTALSIARSLTRCIEELHDESRVHGGLNGESIYLVGENQIEIRDADVFDGQFHQEFSKLPTHSLYLYAPESCGSLAREITSATDLYSIGALLFCMLANRPPVQADSAGDYLDRQLFEPAPRLRELGIDIPPALDDVVARLLQRDPHDRYRTAPGLLHDLDMIIDLVAQAEEYRSIPIGTRDVRSTLTESNLVGREDELSTVRQAMQGAQQGIPLVQIISGSDSSIRQRFIDEVALIGRSQGMYVFRGGASTSDPKPLQSLQPVLATITSLCSNDAALSKLVSEATGEHRSVLTELLPALADLWDDFDESIGPDAYGGRRAAVALKALFSAFASNAPGLVLLFDDLDQADELTQTVVRSLAEGSDLRGSTPYLHIVVSGEYTETSESLRSDSQVTLAPLPNRSLTSYLRSSAGKLPYVVTESIVDVADGDPSMASTILRRMIDTQVVVPSELGWQAAGPLSEALQVDESIGELLEHQIDSLDPEAINTLMAAAVIGQQFGLRVLSHLTESSYADVLEICSDAVRRRLLWRDPSGDGFRFANNLTHEQLRCRLDADSRRQLHLQAANYFEEHEPENVFELAIHCDAAGDGDRALSHALAAARIARKKYSLSIARDHLEIAKRWLDNDDAQTGLEIWEGLGEIDLLSGRYDEAETNLNEAFALAKPGFYRARVQLKLGELDFKRGHFAEAAGEYEHALAMTGIRVPGNVVSMLGGLLSQTLRQTIHTWVPTRWYSCERPPSDLDCLQLQLLSRLSLVYWFSRHKLWTLGNHLRSLNIAERFAPSETLAAVYSEHGPVLSLLRWFKRANKYALRSLAIRQEFGDIWGQGQSHHYHSVVKLAQCDFEDSIQTAEQAVEMLRKMGDFWEMNMARYQAANAYFRIGNYDDALKQATEMYNCGREIGDKQATGISLDVWARTSPHTLPIETAAEEAGKSRPDAQSHAQTHLAYAIILLFNNRTDEAIEVLEKAIERCEAAGHLNLYISPCYAWLASALRTQVEQTERRNGRQLAKRTRRARRAIAKAARIARVYPADRAHCFRELGLIHAIGGNVKATARYLNRSLSASKENHQTAEEWETLQCILALHDREPELFADSEPELRLRFDELNESFTDKTRNTNATNSKSSNLSIADRFVTVLQSGRRIAQALSSDVVYAEASEAARKLLRGQFVDVVQIEERDEQLFITAMSDISEDDQARQRIADHDAIIRAASNIGQAVCDTAPDVPRLQSGSAIATPIAFRGVNVAVILVTHSELKSLFSTDEQRIAEFVSTLAGAALENADGFLRLRQLNDTLEQRVRDRTKAAEERAQQLAVSNEQLRETEDQLREAIVHANAANEAKGRFLATISHEIRTPLNGILGMTSLARQSSVDQKQTNYLDTVQESGESLLTLINDLLDVSKLESGKVELEQIPLDPRSLAAEISRLMTASASQKSVALGCDIDSSVPQSVIGDPSRLRQIVMNLIGNAIKFTEQGSVTLKLDYEQAIEDQDWLLVAVQDTGIGIPADKIDSVFDSFSQVDSSTTRRYGGTGLGLAICRELAEVMGGSITVESQLGVGSQFSVRLPMPTNLDPSLQPDKSDTLGVDADAVAADQPVGSLPDPLPSVALSTDSTPARSIPASEVGEDANEELATRILVAEDGMINQEVIVGMLELNGYQAIVASDGEEALRKAADGPYAVCLMDVDMPKMDGIEATRMIRKTVPGCDRDSLPIIAMTAHSGDQIWSKCKAAGMNAYIPKPIDPHALFEQIERFCQADLDGTSLSNSCH